MIFEDAGNWLVEAREGDSEGPSRWYEASDETRALEIVGRLMDGSDGWGELTPSTVDDRR